MSRPTQKDGSSSSQGLEKDITKKGGKSLGPKWQFVTNINRYIYWNAIYVMSWSLEGHLALEIPFKDII